MAWSLPVAALLQFLSHMSKIEDKQFLSRDGAEEWCCIILFLALLQMSYSCGLWENLLVCSLPHWIAFFVSLFFQRWRRDCSWSICSTQVCLTPLQQGHRSSSRLATTNADFFWDTRQGKLGVQRNEWKIGICSKIVAWFGHGIKAFTLYVRCFWGGLWLRKSRQPINFHLGPPFLLMHLILGFISNIFSCYWKLKELVWSL